MACLFSELRCKEVIDLHSGQRLGYVCDAEYDPCDGKILSIIVPGQGRARVVAGALGKAGAALSGPDVVGLHVDAHGLHAGGIVGAGGGGQDAEEVIAGGMDAQLGRGGDGKRPEVEGGADLIGDPGLLHPAEGADGLDEVLLRDLRHAHAAHALHHAAAVAVRPEEADLAVRAPVGLQALEAGLAIVQDGGRRVQGQGTVGDDPGVVPALLGGVVHQEHVVGEEVAEAQRRAFGGLFLGGVGFVDGDVQHACSLLSKMFRLA